MEKDLDSLSWGDGASILKEAIIDMPSLNDYRQKFGLSVIEFDEEKEDNLTFPKAYMTTMEELQTDKMWRGLRMSFLEGQTRATGCAAIMTGAIVDGNDGHEIIPGSLNCEYFKQYLSQSAAENMPSVDVLSILKDQRESGNFFLDSLVSIKVKYLPSSGKTSGLGDAFNANECLRQARELSALHQREKKNSSERPLSNEIYGILSFVNDLVSSDNNQSLQSFENKSKIYQTCTVKKDISQVRPKYLDLPAFKKFLDYPSLAGAAKVYEEIGREFKRDGETITFPMQITDGNTIADCQGCYPDGGQSWGMDPLELNAIPIFILGCKAATRALNHGIDNWGSLEKELAVKLLVFHNRTFSDGIYPADDKGLSKQNRSYGLKMLWFGSYLSNIVNWGLANDKIPVAMRAFARSEEHLFKPTIEQVLKEHGTSHKFLLRFFCLHPRPNMLLTTLRNSPHAHPNQRNLVQRGLFY